ncbi:MAG TPA: DUF4190 domain-containing protein [Verrucomicrobiae bacterium]|jgi:hypothetical protein|nr:DUF4190 domain-containing protein [Verrucomicrobiae bacterium]
MKKCPRCGKEYSDATEICSEDGENLTSIIPPLPRNRFATVSEVLGLLLAFSILAFICTWNTLQSWNFYGLLIIFGTPVGLVAIICGHIARSRSKKQPNKYRQSEAAMVGLATGYIGTFLTAFSLFQAIFHPVRNAAPDLNCQSNLKQLALAARIFAGDHNDVLPTNFLQMTNEMVNPLILHCPSDTNHPRPVNTVPATWNTANISYELLTPGEHEDDTTNRAIIRCPIHGFEVWGDGSVHKSKLKH